ncbi:MAG: hypothetical protein NZ534_11115, partial [Bacteroidia bacterium]|nr:hypothetical protein [Bacteroidia bacterium]
VVERIEGDETLTFLNDGVKIVFYDSSGKQDAILTARRAVMHNKRGYAEALENVVVVNQKNERLETERLRWRRTDNTLSTGALVKVSTPEETIFGDSLASDASFRRWRVFQPRGKVLLKE